MLVVRRLGGSSIVDDLAPSTAVKPAAQDAWDILTSQLRDGGFTFLGLGVILLVALWLVGPSPSGVSARRRLAPYLARPEIAYGVAGGLFLLLLWWSPTVQTTRAPLMLAAALVLGLGSSCCGARPPASFPPRRPTWVDPSAGAWEGFEAGRPSRTGSQRWSVSASFTSRAC